jgi:PAS domain S-box-containing protein
MKHLIPAAKSKLSRQLLIGIGTSLVVVAIAAISIIYTSLRTNLEEQVQKRAITITQGLEFASEGLIEDKELFLLERIVQNYSTLPTVLELAIVDPSGAVLAHSLPMNSGENNLVYADLHPYFVPYLQKTSQNGTEVTIRTVVNGKSVIVQFLPFSSALFKKLGKTPTDLQQYRGVAIAIMDLQEIERELLQNTIFSIVVSTVSTLLILVCIGWLIRRLVLIPLRKIQLAIVNSESDQKIILPALPNNEIGSLGTALVSSFEQLKAYREMELDIAERKYAEVVQRYELATQSAQVWVWDWDIRTDLFVLECGIQNWFGYDKSQIPNRFDVWLSHIYIDDRDTFRDLLQNNLDGKTFEFVCEHRLLDAQGNPHWFLSRGQTVFDDNGKAIRATGTINDIAERKQAEELLRQQSERESLLLKITRRIRQSFNLEEIFADAVTEIRLSLNTDRVGIFKFDPDSNFNDGEFIAESVLPEFTSALAVKVHDHCFGDQYAAFYEQGRIQDIPDIYNANLTDCHIKVLSQFQIRANLVLPLNNANQLWGLVCIHQCDSPRIWQAIEIDLLQQITNQLAIAIQQSTLFMQLQLELKERQHAEALLTETNQRLAISNEDLVRATKMKDEFLANMSHELRTPLNSILGMNEALQDQVFGVVNERQTKALRTVEGSATHLLALINDILDVSKIESGQVTLDLTPTGINALAQSSLAFIKQQAHAKRIQVINQIPPNLPKLILDERRIRQVLINLLNNAVKFTPEGGTITLEVSQILGKAEETSYLSFAVIDTGIGISAENISKLFQPFIQIDSALNRQYIGTGLGLALVKRIAELHGGRVRLTSEVGVGSRFIVELPLIMAEPDLESPYHGSFATVESNQVIDENSVSPLILLADDNKANIVTFSSYLEAKGYKMIIANNGQEAIDFARSQKPDLILIDIQMPVLDGLAAMKQIRLDPSLVNIPIVALTALAMAGDREKCLEAGANEYLSKPIKLKTLADTIRNILKNRN